MLNERHVWKEVYGCTLALCIGPRESHDPTFGQKFEIKESHHVCTYQLVVFNTQNHLHLVGFQSIES